MVLAGMAAGALWGFIPGFLKAQLNVNEIITTLMLNYIALRWIQFWVFGPWSEGGFQMSRPFPKAAWLPRLTDFADQFPGFAGLTIHLGIIFALVAAVLVWFILNRSRWGYEIRLIGDNAGAAHYAGINIARNTILVMMLSGALAGLAGMTEVAGVVHRLQRTSRPATASPPSSSPAWPSSTRSASSSRPSSSAALILAGREIQPSGVPGMFQGIILFCVIASDVLLRYRVRVVRRVRG